MSGTVRSASLANYIEVAQTAGLDPYLMLRRVGIDAQALTNLDMRVPVKRVSELLEASARASGRSDFGLRMAETRRSSDLGVISLLLPHQRTLRDVLETMVRYRNMMNAALGLHVEDAGDVVVIREELVVDFEGPKVQSYELTVGVMMRLIRSILGPRWKPVSVHFTHPRPKDLATHRRIFGENLEFDSEFNGIVCEKGDLDRLNTTADPTLARYASQFLDSLQDAGQTTFSHEVRKCIYMLLPVGGATLARIARSLDLNERTLQRRLAAEGVEFSDLLSGVRRELAERYTANASFSLSRIADMLGYGQLSSFTRWFASEFGVAPGEWRKRTMGKAV